MQQILRQIPFVLFTIVLILWTTKILSSQNTGISLSWPQIPKISLQSWHFDPIRDANDFMLNDEQCNMAFPDLYQETERSTAYWKARGGVRRDDIDISFAKMGAARLRISKKQLYIMETKGLTANHSGIKERGLSTLQQIYLAALLTEDLPDIEFSVAVADRIFEESHLSTTSTSPQLAIWSYSRKKDRPAHDALWLVPDFNFFSWGAVGGSYLDYRHTVTRTGLDTSIEEKIPKMIWRGAVWTNPEVRGALLDASNNKTWSDIEGISWDFTTIKGNAVSTADHCRYAMNVHTEGRSWSGRLKYLLNCRAVTFVHDLDWTAFYYHLLNAEGAAQNIVATYRNFTDLEGQVDRLLEDPAEMQRIADNAAVTFRDKYLTPAAVACYWRRLLRSYAAVSFKPVDNEEEPKMTFERWIVHQPDWPTAI